MLDRLAIKKLVAIILSIETIAILGAWTFEYWGYLPCPLCLKQRWPYYAIILLSLLIIFCNSQRLHLIKAYLWVIFSLAIVSMIFGIYHSGIEWKWWLGPQSCSGSDIVLKGLPDLDKPFVSCSAPALRLFSLSLAGWNAVISLCVALISFTGTQRKPPNS